MCIVCVEWEKGKLTNEEALSALGEMIVFESDMKNVGHYFDLEEKILKKEKEDEKG